MQSNKWKTFKALNNTPFETGYTFALNCYVELGNRQNIFCFYLPCFTISHHVCFLYLVIAKHQRYCIGGTCSLGLLPLGGF